MCEKCFYSKDGKCTRINKRGQNVCWMETSEGEY